MGLARVNTGMKFKKYKIKIRGLYQTVQNQESNLAQFKRPVHANFTSKIMFGSKHSNIQKANH